MSVQDTNPAHTKLAIILYITKREAITLFNLLKI